jgi:hypothetical protein
MGVIFGIIRLYFTIGLLFAALLFTSMIWLAYTAPPPRPDTVAVIGDALLAAFFRFFLWAPQLYQLVVRGEETFWTWSGLSAFGLGT